MRPRAGLVHTESIESRILLIRGARVMLDADLAVLYGVETRALNQAVRRNLGRFPGDFAFQLTPMEVEHLKSQNVITSSWGGRRYRPRAFTEEGVAMLSSVLKSQRAIEVNIAIMRAFVRLRGILSANEQFARKLEQLERKLACHDGHILKIVEALRKLAAPSVPAQRRIGFHVKLKK